MKNARVLLMGITCTSGALAATVPSADNRLPPVGIDGRQLNHLPYDDSRSRLLPLYSARLGEISKGVGQRPCELVQEARDQVRTLLVAANNTDWDDGWQLRALSCTRTKSQQRDIFFSKVPSGSGLDGVIARARKSAPPGFSEHETGYALDFVVRPAPGENPPKIDCGAEGEPCEKQMQTKVGDWLQRNAWKYGFELSFPCQDKTDPNQCMTWQGVAYEPWHWRWVGANDRVTGQAQTARRTFARARKCFKADPGIAPFSDAAETDQPITCPPPIGS